MRTSACLFRSTNILTFKSLDILAWLFKFSSGKLSGPKTQLYCLDVKILHWIVHLVGLSPQTYFNACHLRGFHPSLNIKVYVHKLLAGNVFSFWSNNRNKVLETFC